MYKYFFKRLLDILISGIGLICLSPILLILAVLVRVKLGSPVIFKQERPGLNEKIFTLNKFRTMTDERDAEGKLLPDAERLTKFGRFLRSTSLDELPELWNIFTGDMSLIGPRPEVPFHVRHFKEEVPRYLVRQQVRPGITGWAQVNGLRGDTSIEERVKYDIWYIENWSIWLDVKILLMTAFGGMVNPEKIK